MIFTALSGLVGTAAAGGAAGAAAAGTLIGGGAAIFGGIMAYEQGMMQKRMHEYNAEVGEQSARARELKGRFDQIRFERQKGKIAGSLLAKLSASGAMTDVGAPLQLIIENEAEMALESALIGYETEIEARRLRTGADISRMRASIAGTRAGMSLWGGFGEGAGTTLTGWGRGVDEGWIRSAA